MSGARIIVCGGRDYADREQLHDVLKFVNDSIGIGFMFHGNARGADTLAAEWAGEHGVTAVAVPADWAKHGKSAGPKRNQAMLELAGANGIVVAFPGGQGTADMVRRARRAGLQIIGVEAGRLAIGADRGIGGAPPP